MSRSEPSGAPPKTHTQPTQLAAIAGARRKRWTMVFLGSAALTLLTTALVVATTLLQPPKPIEIVAVGAHYATDLSVPHNAYGWRGLEEACGLHLENPALCRSGLSLCFTAAAPALADDRFTWRQALRNLKGETLVLVVSMHGGADAAGPYLLCCSRSSEGVADTQLRIEDLLQVLRRQPPSRRTLLIMDATVAPGNWRQGVLRNRFAEGMRALNDALLKTPNLTVLLASDLAERSWPESMGGTTTFLRAVLDGLRGAATDHDHDGRVTAAELSDYVQSRVVAQSSVVRQRSQTPVLLPLGEEGRRRAAAMDLALASRERRRATDRSRELPQEELTRRWEAARKLSDALQIPETAATVAWRRYRRLLIRYEQLLIAGASRQAREVADQLDDLTANLKRVAGQLHNATDPVQLDRPCPSESLDTVADTLLGTLWKSLPGDMANVWNSEIARLEPGLHSGLRRLLYDRILDRVSDDPCGQLLTAAFAVRAVSDISHPLPAEVHFLVALANESQIRAYGPQWERALRLAIETRRYSEAVLVAQQQFDQPHTPALLPWLKQRYMAADDARRAGEDLLFGGVDYLPRACARLTAAKALYEQLNQEADVARNAIRVRNVTLDQLSFAADMVAAAVTGSKVSRVAVDRLTLLIEQAWESAHALDEQLVSADRMVSTSGQAVMDLGAAAGAAQQRLLQLQTALDEWRYDLLKQTGASLYNNTEAALLLPNLELGERMRLLTAKPEQQAASADGARGLTLAPATQRAVRDEESLRYARIAMASLGQRLFDRSAAGATSYQRLAAKIKRASRGEAAEEEPGASNERRDPVSVVCRLAEVCLQRCRRSWRSQIAAMDPVAMDSALSGEERARTAHAASLVRRLVIGAEGSSSMALLNQIRRRRAFDYFIWRANRLIDGQWNSINGVGEPYYRLAAGRYLEVAERAMPGRAETSQVAQRAELPVQLSIEAPAQIDIVAGQAPAVPYRVENASKAGAAAVSFAASKGLCVRAPADGTRQVFTMADEDSPVRQPTMGVIVGPADDASTDSRMNQSGSVSITAWFRCHRKTRAIHVASHSIPDIEINNPPAPDQAGLALLSPPSMDHRLREGSGAVAFVLDASGSMGSKGDPASSKYSQAVAALNSLLSETPAGVQVSVWVFGQAIGAGKTTDTPEETIHRAIGPIDWDPDDVALARHFERQLAYPRVEPWNESPLGRAILAAARDVRPSPGYKAVVAITDGADNRFLLDRAANPTAEPLGHVLRQELHGAGVSLHVVGFRIAEAELADAERQFQFLSKLDPPGRWWRTDQRHELTVALQRALHHRPRVKLRATAPVNVADSGWAYLSRHADPTAWHKKPLSPGIYELGADQSEAKARQAQRVALGKGDLLLLTLRESPRGYYLAPAQYAAREFPQKPAQSTSAWRTTLLDRRQLPNGARSSLVCVEPQPVGLAEAQATLSLTKPLGVWIEASESAPTPSRISWRSAYGRPAPCWEVVVDDQQERSSGNKQLRFWWTTDHGVPPAISWRRGEDYEQLSDLEGRSRDVQGQPVTIRRAVIQTRRLPDEGGKLVETQCLLVEVASRSLFQVRLHGPPTEGSRHQFFREADRYVGLFWPMTSRQFRDGVPGIDLLSIEQIKQSAEDRDAFASFHELPPASPAAHRPLPAVGWLGAAGH